MRRKIKIMTNFHIKNFDEKEILNTYNNLLVSSKNNDIKIYLKIDNYFDLLFMQFFLKKKYNTSKNRVINQIINGIVIL